MNWIQATQHIHRDDHAHDPIATAIVVVLVVGAFLIGWLR